LSEVHERLPFVRKKVGDFLYPYGSFPDDDFEQQEGYESEYQSPQADEEGGERYRVEVLVSAEKLVALFGDLCTLLPQRVSVSLERASADAYSRWDEFVSDEISRQEFLDIFHEFEFTLAEDGHLGIGAFAQEPPVEVFLGSHKELVVFAPNLGEVTAILRRHGLKSRRLDLYYQREHSHVALLEYRGLRGSQFDYLHVADVIRHALGMQLRMDDDENVDADGNPLGLVPWHAAVIGVPVRRARAWRRSGRAFMQEFGLTAANRREARELLEHRLQEDGDELESIEELFRLEAEELPAHAQPPPGALDKACIWYVGEKTDATDHTDPRE
jgi:hypothetical protein